MTDLPLHLVAEDTKTITFGWTPIPCEGYVFLAGGKRVSNTWDPTVAKIRFGKVPAGRYAVRALAAAAEGTWPKPGPTVSSDVQFQTKP